MNKFADCTKRGARSATKLYKQEFVHGTRRAEIFAAFMIFLFKFFIFPAKPDMPPSAKSLLLPSWPSDRWPYAHLFPTIQNEIADKLDVERMTMINDREE